MRSELNEEDVKRIREAWKRVQETIRQFVEAVREVTEKLKDIFPDMFRAIFRQRPPRRSFRERELIKQSKIIARFKQYERKKLNAVSRVYKPP